MSSIIKNDDKKDIKPGDLVLGYIVNIHDPINFDVDLYLSPQQLTKYSALWKEHGGLLTNEYEFYDTNGNTGQSYNTKTERVNIEDNRSAIRDFRYRTFSAEADTGNKTSATVISGIKRSISQLSPLVSPSISAAASPMIASTPNDSPKLDAKSGSSPPLLSLGETANNNMDHFPPVPAINKRTAYRCRLRDVGVKRRQYDKVLNKIFRSVYGFVKRQIDLQNGWVVLRIGTPDVYQRLLVDIYDPISGLDIKSIHFKEGPKVFYPYVWHSKHY